MSLNHIKESFFDDVKPDSYTKDDIVMAQGAKHITYYTNKAGEYKYSLAFRLDIPLDNVDTESKFYDIIDDIEGILEHAFNNNRLIADFSVPVFSCISKPTKEDMAQFYEHKNHLFIKYGTNRFNDIYSYVRNSPRIGEKVEKISIYFGVQFNLSEIAQNNYDLLMRTFPTWLYTLCLDYLKPTVGAINENMSVCLECPDNKYDFESMSNVLMVINTDIDAMDSTYDNIRNVFGKNNDNNKNYSGYLICRRCPDMKSSIEMEFAKLSMWQKNFEYSYSMREERCVTAKVMNKGVNLFFQNNGAVSLHRFRFVKFDFSDVRKVTVNVDAGDKAENTASRFFTECTTGVFHDIEINLKKVKRQTHVYINFDDIKYDNIKLNVDDNVDRRYLHITINYENIFDLESGIVTESTFDDNDLKNYDFGSDIVIADSDEIKPNLNPDNDYKYALRFYMSGMVNDNALRIALKSKNSFSDFIKDMSADIIEIVNYTSWIKDMSYPQFNGSIDLNDRCKIPVEPVVMDGIYVDSDMRDDSLYDRLKYSLTDSMALTFKFNVTEAFLNNGYKNIIQSYLNLIEYIKKLLVDSYSFSVSASMFNMHTKKYVVIKCIDPDNILYTIEQIANHICEHSMSFDFYPIYPVFKYSDKTLIISLINTLFNNTFDGGTTCNKPYVYDRKTNSVMIRPEHRLLRFKPDISKIDGREVFKAFKFDLSEVEILQIPITLQHYDFNTQRKRNIDFERILNRYIHKFPPLVIFVISFPKDAPDMADEEAVFRYIDRMDLMDMEFRYLPFNEVHIRCPWKSQRVRAILPLVFDDNVNIIYEEK